MENDPEQSHSIYSFTILNNLFQPQPSFNIVPIFFQPTESILARFFS